MPYSTADARQDLLDAVADAIDELSRALAALTEAYELLDERKADELEESLFGPVQAALGRARRTYEGFGRRHGGELRAFDRAAPPAPSAGVKARLDEVVSAVNGADATLSTLQDSMLPVDVGDPQLRAGLAEVRELIAGIPARTRALARTFGR